MIRYTQKTFVSSSRNLIEKKEAEKRKAIAKRYAVTTRKRNKSRKSNEGIVFRM